MATFAVPPAYRMSHKLDLVGDLARHYGLKEDIKKELQNIIDQHPTELAGVMQSRFFHHARPRIDTTAGLHHPAATDVPTEVAHEIREQHKKRLHILQDAVSGETPQWGHAFEFMLNVRLEGTDTDTVDDVITGDRGVLGERLMDFDLTRVLVVRADITMAELSEALLRSFGWKKTHEHHFDVSTIWADLADVHIAPRPRRGLAVIAEDTVPLNKLFVDVGDSCLFVYDGVWRHRVTLYAVGHARRGYPRVRLVSGAGDAPPPEDCTSVKEWLKVETTHKEPLRPWDHRMNAFNAHYLAQAHFVHRKEGEEGAEMDMSADERKADGLRRMRRGLRNVVECADDSCCVRTAPPQKRKARRRPRMTAADAAQFKAEMRETEAAAGTEAAGGGEAVAM